MAKTNLQLRARGIATDKAITTTITHVNPEADSTTLRQFGSMLNGLTDDIYVETNRIQTINVDTEEVIIPKLTGSISINSNAHGTRNGTAIVLGASNFTVNGQQLTSIPEDNYIFGYASTNSGMYGVLASKSLNGVMIRTSDSTIETPTGTYSSIRLALKETDEYTAATYSANNITITV